jgi:hypothetical protein
MKIKALLIILIISQIWALISCGRLGTSPSPIYNNNSQISENNNNFNNNNVGLNNNNYSPPQNNNNLPANRIEGVFLWVDQNNAGWNQDRWDKELEWIHSLDMNTIIIAASILKDSSLSLYPSSIPGLSQTGNQPINKILTRADSLGMDVYVGLALTNNWFLHTDQTFLADLAELNKNNFDELYSQYSSHASFKGIYIPQEIDNMTWTNETVRLRLVNYFLKPLTDHINDANASLIICTAPFFNNAFQQPAEYQAWWNSTLSETPNLDLIILQDGIGAEHANYADVVSYFTALKNACESNGRSLWSDLEIYHNPSPPLVPASIERVVQQINTEAPLVDKIVCWEFDNYLSPAHSLKSLDLYNNYLCFLRSSSTLENVSEGKSYIINPSPSGSYPDSGGELTNGNADYSWSEQVGWWNQSVVSIDLDLGAIFSDLVNFRAFFMRSTASSVIVPSSVIASVSSDGFNFTPVGSLSGFTEDDGKINAYQLSLNNPVSARYIKYTIYSSQWLMLSEVSAYRRIN